jgi:hypothetical protein
MTTITAHPGARTDASWLRTTQIALVVAALSVLAMGVSMLTGQAASVPGSEGSETLQGIGDYILTASALPQGVALFVATFGFHRLQHGRDGRLGTIGVWVYGLCMLELVTQCMASVAAGAELIWGPAYPLCALGLMIGLALLAAGTWSVGLAPRWMLALWPLLGLFGSFFGIGPIPLVFVVFLVVLSITLGRRAERA